MRLCVQKRILFSGFVETAEENFQRLAAADLVLDTTVYGAHTGAVDALYAGKGLLTCRGPRCSTPVRALVHAGGVARLVTSHMLEPPHHPLRMNARRSARCCRR